MDWVKPEIKPEAIKLKENIGNTFFDSSLSYIFLNVSSDKGKKKTKINIRLHQIRKILYSEGSYPQKGRDFPEHPLAKTHTLNVRDPGSTSGQGTRSHMSQLNLHAATKKSHGLQWRLKVLHATVKTHFSQTNK